MVSHLLIRIARATTAVGSAKKDVDSNSEQKALSSPSTGQWEHVEKRIQEFVKERFDAVNSHVDQRFDAINSHVDERLKEVESRLTQQLSALMNMIAAQRT